MVCHGHYADARTRERVEEGAWRPLAIAPGGVSLEIDAVVQADRRLRHGCPQDWIACPSGQPRAGHFGVDGTGLDGHLVPAELPGAGQGARAQVVAQVA